MRKRTIGVLLGAFLLLAIGTMGCSVSQLIARRAPVTVTPTRTPRPTWTPVAGGIQVATPTLDLTRFPGLALPTAAQTAAAPTPQQLVPGSEDKIFVPQPTGGGPAVQTVVVIIVTATPQPSATAVSLPPATPLPTETPGPPTATPTATNTSPPPVMVRVTVDKANVRQGPGTGYPVVTQLAVDTEVTVVGRNRAGNWWKICCVNGADVWIADSVVAVEGPVWLAPEVSDIPPPPPTAAPTATPAPTATYAWPFRTEGPAEGYPLGQNYFSVKAVIYNGASPLWGYKLRVRKLSTGEEWLSEGSQSNNWNWIVIGWPDDGKPVNPSSDCPSPRTGLLCLKSNVKWDSNGVGVPMGDDRWEVTATDRFGNPLSAPVLFDTSAANSKWYYVVFTSRP